MVERGEEALEPIVDIGRDELIRRLKELRPEFAKILLQFGAHEPNWEPLENSLMSDFMFMGYCDGILM